MVQGARFHEIHEIHPALFQGMVQLYDGDLEGSHGLTTWLAGGEVLTTIRACEGDMAGMSPDTGWFELQRVFP